MPFWTSWGSHMKAEVFGSRAIPGKRLKILWPCSLGDSGGGKGGGTGSRGSQSTRVKLNGIVKANVDAGSSASYQVFPTYRHTRYHELRYEHHS